MFTKLSFANTGAIITDIETLLTSADGGSWDSVATDLPGSYSGFIFTNVGSGAADFPLQFVLVKKAGENFIKGYSAELIDTGGGDGTVINLLDNPSFEAVTADAADDWDVFTPVYAITAVSTVNETFTIAGLHGADFEVGASFDVDGSTGNDGTYTVVSAVEGGGNTVITVEENVGNAVADGNIILPAARQLTAVTETGIKYRYIEDASVKAAWTSTHAENAAFYTTTAALNAAAHVLSFYVRMLKGSVEDLSGFAQDADGAPAVDPTGGNLIAITDADYETLEDGWVRVSLELTPAAHAYYIGVAAPANTVFFVDGAMLEEKAAAPASPYTNNAAGTDVIGTVLRNGSDEFKVLFSSDATGITNEAEAFVAADENSVSIGLGNTKSGDQVYNGFFYGRLVTPTGDPVDAENSTRVDMTALAIGCTCHDRGEGKVQLFRDYEGRFWTDYSVFDTAVGNANTWGGGPMTKYNRWGQQKFIKQYPELFMKDLYWKKNANIVCVFHPTEGFRGYLPNIFTADRSAAEKAEFNVYPVKGAEIVRNACSSAGNGTTLNDTGVNFSTLGVLVGDVAYLKRRGYYVRITNVAANVLTTEALANSEVWGDGDEYAVMRRVAFNALPVSFAPGTEADTVGSGTPENRSFNNFSPYNNLKNPFARRTSILIIE